MGCLNFYLLYIWLNSPQGFDPDSVLKTLNSLYSFEDYKVEVYQGKPAPPDFTEVPYTDDPAFVEFITRGCERNGINFGGHYTILGKGCGAMCVFIFMVDRIDGRILFVEGIESGSFFGYECREDSLLFLGNSESFIDGKYERYVSHFGKPEFYLWKGERFVLLE
ncbi:MAG: hypothetical protein LIP01_12715 [Tannerellaceae bacterium]|nr:hypothetical protein [Tannerellaceae bacterium]